MGSISNRISKLLILYGKTYNDINCFVMILIGWEQRKLQV